MFFVRLKSKEEILQILKPYKKFLYIVCSGCNEVNFSVKEAVSFFENNKEFYEINIKILDYICNLDFANKYINYLYKQIQSTEAIIVFSCGIGVSTIASFLEKEVVLSICNTFYLNGYKGYNVVYEGKFECLLCGSCYLNYTVGICPIANCSKSLLNGPCGGAKGGKCEVDKMKDCVWEKIFFKLKRSNKLKILLDQILIHNHKTLL